MLEGLSNELKHEKVGIRAKVNDYIYTGIDPQTKQEREYINV